VTKLLFSDSFIYIYIINVSCQEDAYTLSFYPGNQLMKTVSRQIYLSSNLSSFFRRTGADPAENLRQLD
jgi:hypothetical protein